MQRPFITLSAVALACSGPDFPADQPPSNFCVLEVIEGDSYNQGPDLLEVGCLIMELRNDRAVWVLYHTGMFEDQVLKHVRWDPKGETVVDLGDWLGGEDKDAVMRQLLRRRRAEVMRRFRALEDSLRRANP